MDKIKKLTKFKQVQPKGTSPKTITKLSKSWTGLQAHPGGHEFNSQNHRRKVTKERILTAIQENKLFIY